jgi:hypothetical protein
MVSEQFVIRIATLPDNAETPLSDLSALMRVVPTPTVATASFDAPVIVWRNGNGEQTTAVLTNIGSTNGLWSASVSDAWLSVGPANGSLATGGSTAVVVFGSAPSSAGTHGSLVSLTMSDTVVLPLIADIAPAGLPRFDLNASRYFASVTQGTGLVNLQPFVIGNIGDASLNWEASAVMNDLSTTCAWLALNSLSASGSGSVIDGSLFAGQNVIIGMSIDATGLSVGIYDALVLIVDRDGLAPESALVVPVRLAVTPPVVAPQPGTSDPYPVIVKGKKGWCAQTGGYRSPSAGLILFVLFALISVSRRRSISLFGKNEQ